MYYEINVSLNGMHFFATDERSIKDSRKLYEVYYALKERFSEKDGFEISVTEWNILGKSVEMEDK